jgi:hypothetical protein
MDAPVTRLLVYPRSGAPGEALDAVEIASAGPVGNRPKDNAVHLVTTAEYAGTGPRANVVVDLDTATLHALVGRQVRLGSCTLAVVRRPAHCAGVYADVVSPGPVRVGDRLTQVEPSAAPDSQ